MTNRSRFAAGLAAVMAGLLSACAGVTPAGAAPASDAGYVLTVQIGQGDSPDAVTAQYGGQVLTWMPELGVAHLKLSTQAHAALKSRGVSLQSTANGSLKAPEAGISGFSAWAGGFSAWAGGFSAWAGGWSAWAGGTSSAPTPPADNDAIWKLIRLYEANQAALNFGRGIKVAVIDTGIDLSHPVFGGRLAPQAEWRDFVDGDNTPQETGWNSDKGYGHGTAVAGIIAQMAPRAAILPIRVLNKDGTGSLDAVISAVYHAVNSGARVINLSLGSYDYYQPLTDVINFAVSRKVLVVASAGNEGSAGAATFPAEMAWYSGNFPFQQYLYSVGSSTPGRAVSNFSNRGSTVLTYAPGEAIVTAYPGSRTTRASGTSFAAPLYAGALALALGENPSMSDPRNLHTYFLSNADWPTGFTSANYGILNVQAGVRGARGLSEVNYLASPWLHNLIFWTWKSNAEIFQPGHIDFAGTKVVGQGGVGQVVTDLRPNTTYVFRGWARVDDPSFPLSVGVKHNGATEVAVHTSSTAWTWMSVEFTTGPSNTFAEVYLWKNGATGNAYFDQFSLFRK